MVWDGNLLLFPVKEKYGMCSYNPKYFMSIGRIIDDIIMNLFINKAHGKTSSFTMTCLPKLKIIMFLFKKVPFQILNRNIYSR